MAYKNSSIQVFLSFSMSEPVKEITPTKQSKPAVWSLFQDTQLLDLPYFFNSMCQVPYIVWNLNASYTGLWSRSRCLGLETYQRLVSVSSGEKLSTSRSREAVVSVSSRSRPFTSPAQDQFSAKLCRLQYTVWTGF